MGPGEPYDPVASASPHCGESFALECWWPPLLLSSAHRLAAAGLCH